MININLLPWRDEQRAEQQKQFIVGVVASMILGLIILALWHFSISKDIAYQQSRNQFLTQSLLKMNKEIQALKKGNVEKVQILQNLRLIQDLHNSKFEIVGVLDELVQIVPKHVHFTRIDRHNDKITLEGTATSNEKITQLMRNLNHAKWLSNPVLKEIHTDELNPSEKDFKLVAEQRGTKLNLSTINSKRGKHGV